MNKIIMTLGIASSLLTSTVKKDGTIINSVEQNKYIISEALNNIQDMKEWMQSDIDKDNIITDLGEYYLEYLNETEDLLINEINK
ncbi:MAG: hypothetical protein OET18_02900 [Desulfobacterales bacterium]|jgi:hypothetical protein|nr:hypothetical protein [Desulfobacterales bacterium]